MLIAGEIGIDLKHDLESDLARFPDQRHNVVGGADGRIGLQEVDDVDGRERRYVAVVGLGVVEGSSLEKRGKRNRAGAKRLDVLQIRLQAL